MHKFDYTNDASLDSDETVKCTKKQARSELKGKTHKMVWMYAMVI